MARLIWWLLVGVLVWWGLRKWHRPTASARQAPSPSQSGPTAMVACAYCGVHLPQEDALQVKQLPEPTFYCSAAHAKQSATSGTHDA